MEDILRINYNVKNKGKNQAIYAVHVVDVVNDINYIYIGSGVLGDRINGNINKLKRNVHDCKILQDAYNKFKNVKVEVLEVLERSENEKLFARDLEQNWVDYYKRIENCIVLNKNKTFVNKEEYKYKLTKEDVIEIREVCKDKSVDRKDICKKYGISSSHLSNILCNRKWK